MERESGFYWVKLGYLEWTVGYYDKESILSCKWDIANDNDRYSDDELDEIGERIERKEEG